MKNKFAKTLLLLISSMGILLTSCSQGQKTKPVEPETPGEMEDPESILDDFDFKPTNPIDFSDKAYYYNDHINDVKPEFQLALTANPELESNSQSNALNYVVNNLKASVSIIDRKGSELDLIVKQQEGDSLGISLMNDAFVPGQVYTANLLVEGIVYKNKSPLIKTLYFDVEKEDSFNYSIDKNLKYFNINNVVAFANDEYVELDPASEEAKEWFNTHTYEMIYANNDFSKLKEGENFAVCNFKGKTPELDDKNSFYGKFVSSTKVDKGYKIVYKNADLTEIYKDEKGKPSLNVYQNEKKVEEFRNVRTRFTEAAAKDYFAHDKQFRRFAKALVIATDNELNYTDYDIINMIKVDASFAWNAPKFVVQIKASVSIPINKDRTTILYVEINYQYISEISAGGSVEVETFLGVPYWIEAKSEVTQEITHKVGFKFGFMRHFKPDEQDTSDMKKMIKKAYEKLENDPAYFMDRTGEEASTSGNEKFFPIADVNFPFGGVFSLFISLDIHLVIDFRVLFEYNYINQHTQRLLSFTTSDGVKNTANTETIHSDCHTVDLLGELGIQLGAVVRAGLCITGLSKIFSLGFSVEAGVYLDLKGMVGLTWGSSDDVRFVGGIDFDFGLYGQVSAFIDFLVFHPKYDFIKGKLSLFGFNKSFTIIDLYAPDEMQITQPVTDISTTSLLTVKAFNVSNMEVDVQNFRLDSEVQVKAGDKENKVRPLTVTTDSPYIVLDESLNAILLAPDIPTSFTAHINIKVNDEFTYLLDEGDHLEKTVTVTYKSDKARNVSIKDLTDQMSVDKGKKFRLPNLKSDTSLGDKYNCKLKYDEHFNVVPDGNFNYDNTYYDFVCFTDGTHNYNPGEEILVNNNDIIITPVLKVIIYHTATFYNGKGEVIAVSRVREFTDAIEPSMEEIMKGMDGYTFYGWDRDFTNLTEDIEVYGIYYKGGKN